MWVINFMIKKVSAFDYLAIIHYAADFQKYNLLLPKDWMDLAKTISGLEKTILEYHITI